MSDPDNQTEFEKAGDSKPMSLTQEFCFFIVENKKWWMIPILTVLAVIGILAALGSTGVAPFIYSFF